MDYPEYVKIDDKKYKINTDFRVAIECNRIAEDETICDTERVLGILYTLFGEDGINTPSHYEKLLELAQKYLLCGKEYDIKANEKQDMDFIEDYSYIKTSFRSDYGINIDSEHIHWWEFYDLLNGLSNSELGNCCVLNRIRNLRNYDTSKIKDENEKQKINEAKEQVALKKYKKPKKQATDKQLESAMEFINALKGVDINE